MTAPFNPLDFDIESDSEEDAQILELLNNGTGQPPITPRISKHATTYSPARPASANSIGLTGSSPKTPTTLRPVTTGSITKPSTSKRGSSTPKISSQLSTTSTSTSASNGKATTHHSLNTSNLSTYIYPTNLSIRDYQVNIVHKALFYNLLCSLPTGMGKTFIASTVMLNWYRWTKTAKIIFVAPTRPLVSQQIEACLGITGIPKSDACVMIGGNQKINREELWESKRVFFATPQIVDGDLKKGILDPKSIVCLVIDEAHRATGNYSYVEIVKFIYRFQDSCRILALTATPSSSMDGVQDLINNLNISKTETRSEESIDVYQYMHTKTTTKVKIEQSADEQIILENLDKAVKPLLTEANSVGAYYIKDTSKITQFGALSALQKYNISPAARANQGMAFKVRSIMAILIKIGQAINLLKVHGIGPFYNCLKAYKEESSRKDKKQNQKKSKKDTLFESEGMKDCMNHCEDLMFESEGKLKPDFIGHEKLRHVVDIVQDFFLEGSGSRAIIFSEFRDSAAEIERVLKHYCPINAKTHLFIGQSTTDKKGKDKETKNIDKPATKRGMKQKLQQEVVEKFKKGDYNVLIATSIGEEGLDIGEVDLIICYDQSKSPIRTIQRMGRTGRKREGKVYLLMTNEEEKKSEHSLGGYKYIQSQINKGEKFQYHENNRILPTAISLPVRKETLIEIPEENKEILQIKDKKKDIVEAFAISQKATKRKKSTPKKFFLPDDVHTGFLSASKLVIDEEGNVPNQKVPVVSDDDDDEIKIITSQEYRQGSSSIKAPPSSLPTIVDSSPPRDKNNVDDFGTDISTLKPLDSMVYPLDLDDSSDDEFLLQLDILENPTKQKQVNISSPTPATNVTTLINKKELPPLKHILKKLNQPSSSPSSSINNSTIASFNPTDGLLSKDQLKVFNTQYKINNPPDCVEYDPILGAQSPNPPFKFIPHSTTSNLFYKTIQDMKDKIHKRSRTLTSNEPSSKRSKPN